MQRRWAVLAAAALAMVACSGQRAVESDGLRLYVQRSQFLFGGGLDADITGSLAVEDGCVLLVQDEFPDIAYPVVWPAGTAIASSEPVTIELPSGAMLAVGETVAGGGGSLYQDDVDVAIPEECFRWSPYGEIAVFNANDDPVKG